MISVTVGAAGRVFCQTIYTWGVAWYNLFISVLKLDWNVMKVRSESTNCFSSKPYTRSLVRGWYAKWNTYYSYWPLKALIEPGTASRGQSKQATRNLVKSSDLGWKCRRCTTVAPWHATNLIKVPNRLKRKKKKKLHTTTHISMLKQILFEQTLTGTRGQGCGNSIWTVTLTV